MVEEMIYQFQNMFDHICGQLNMVDHVQTCSLGE